MAYGLTKSGAFDLSSSQYLSITDASQTGLDLSTDFTIEGWFYLETSQAASGTQFLVTKRQSGTGAGYSMALVGGEILQILWRDGDGGNLSTFTCDETMDTGEWHHWAVSVDISVPSATWYKDGVATGTTTVNANATTIDAGTADFEIGARSSNTKYFDGKASLVRVWSDIRTVGEISGNMCNVFGTSEAGLEGEWSLDDVLTDASGNGNTLTNNNSATFAADLPSTCSSSPASNSNFFMFM